MAVCFVCSGVFALLKMGCCILHHYGNTPSQLYIKKLHFISQDVPSFNSSLLRCPNFHIRWPIFCLVYSWVFVLASQDVASFGSSCQDVPSFVRWHIVCMTVCLVCNWVLVLVRMSHPSAKANIEIAAVYGGTVTDYSHWISWTCH